MSVLVEEIRKWPAAVEWCDIHALTGHLAAKLNRRLQLAEVQQALNILAARELIECQGERIRLTEPDRPELQLYGALETYLKSQTLLDKLGLQGGEFVFQNTASGGSRGDGRLSRPDFTLAAIQSWKFDPRRTLEVFSFEVKNRAGATIPAVYEAVAHGRLVHHPYLACPRSEQVKSRTKP